MKNVFVEVNFVVDPQAVENSKNLTLNNYEEIVRDNINRGKDVSCYVILKHLMSQSDMDQIILELCNRITWDDHARVSLGSIKRHYVYSGESINERLVSNATYSFMV
ncbi:MAG: hypothetical protein IKZ54_12460 [Bacteroidales bacterium]|nr:hypothetical protein [Bacteroidales bacterium]